MTGSAPGDGQEPIAVVGMAGRFPGAPDVAAYWELLREGREGLSRFGADDLVRSGVSRREQERPGFVPVGGLIEGQDLFDPAPFGFTDAEAALLDPQHRLFLECAWQALEHAGHGGGRGAGAVGVFAGSMHSAYLASNLTGRWDPTGAGPDPLGSLATAMATQADYLPLQVAYRLNLSGPAVAVATSCSTSLVAVHLAMQSLLTGESDSAIAGGVSLIVPQGRGYRPVPGGIFATDGRVRPFSAEGTGIVYTQGVGAVLLRRLADAVADGDPVLAVLHGSAVNNDGADKAGFTAPSLRGQARVVAEALAVADVEPRDVGLVEAHGTATPLGDPIEVAALRRVFGDAASPWCGLGSVKGNIGHTNSAAGVASLIKAVLAVAHRTLPASLHAHPLNEHLGLPGSPFEVVTRTRPWDTPPFAGVSSFGIGGTNCHVVVGPAPQRAPVAPDPGPALLVVSAVTGEAARATAAAVADAVRTAPADAGNAADAAYTLVAGRAELGHRVAGVGAAGLAAATPVAVGVPAPRLVFAFPGAGSPYPGMGGGLHRDEPAFAAAVDEVADLLAPLLGADVRDALDPGCDPARLRDAGFGLPALFAVSYGLARLLSSWGVRPDALVGHSLGECTAAAVAGALPLPEAARLVAARCTAAARAAGGGAMLAVELPEDAVAAVLARHPEVDLAVVNAPGSCVVSGLAAAVEALRAALRADAVAATLLRVDAAMHSRLMDPELPGLRAALAGMRGHAPAVPVHSTVTGAAASRELADPEHWVRQLRAPVRFADALGSALDAGPASLVEVGPGTSLAALARRQGREELRATVATLDPDRPGAVTTREALGTLWTHGVPVDLAAQTPPGRRRIALPGYTFQRRRLWIDPPEPAAAGSTTDTTIGPEEPLQVPVWSQTAPDEAAAAPQGRWLVHGSGPLGDALRARLAGTGQIAGVVVVLADTHPADPLPAARDAVLTVAGAVAAVAGGPTGDDGPLLMLVTRGAEQVADDPPPDPAQAAAAVLPRVAGQEQPGLRWTALDLPPAPGDPATEAERVAGLLGDASAGTSRALRADTLWERRLIGWQPAPGARLDATRPGGTALLVGGRGAVGRLLARHLARAGLRVVVTSRTADAPDAGLAAAGVEVRRCDAADPAATSALLCELSATGPVELVVHAGGVVAGARLDPLRMLGGAETDPAAAQQLQAHLDAKLGGALALQAAVAALPPGRRPRTVLLMSSAATLLGGVGTGPYAAANAAMDAACRAAPGPTRWTSVVWDGWRPDPGDDPGDGSGDGSRQGAQTVVMTGALDAATGTAAFDRLLRVRALPSQVAVSTTGLAPRITEAGRPRRAPAAGTTPLGETEEVVAAVWSELFGAPVQDAAADFFALGGHSLLGTRMLLALQERTGVQLGLADLLAAPTVRALATRLRGGDPGPSTAPAPAPATEPAPVPPVFDEDGTFAMTRVQHAYWVGRDGGYAGGEVPCDFYLEYDCAGLDLARYEDAWNDVIARHPMLRAVATPAGRFREPAALPRYRIRVHDLTVASEERRAERLALLRERIAHRSGPPDRWPLVQVQAARLPGGRTRLFIGVDVLVCDAASWWITESELRARYQDPGTPLPPLELHPAAAVAALAARRDGPAGQRAAAYWRARNLPGPPALPVRADPGDGPPRFVRRATRLAAGEWAALCETAAHHRVTPTAVLLTVFADVLAEWSGSRGFAVTLTLFDRPPVHPDVHRVVGDFTSLVLHEVPEVPDGAGFAARAAATQARVFADLDHREFSALDVLAEQASATGRVQSVPVVFTSALGMSDQTQAGEDLEWVGEQVHAVSRTPQTWLDHQVLDHDGELRLQWDAPDGLLPGDELDAAVARHTARVRQLATDPTAWATTPGSADRDPADRDPADIDPADIDPADIDPADIVLPLRTGRADPQRPALVLVHPSGGDVLCYAELSRLLDPGVDVVAITDPELSGASGPGPETVPGIAAQYLAALRRQGHTGAWLLGGWSMGGTVAQEMAVQLSSAREHVALLAMLDSNDPTHIRPVPGADADAVAMEVAVRHLRALEAYLGVDLDTGDDAVAALAALSPAARSAEVARRLRAHRLLGRGEDDTALAGRLGVFARHLRALAAHRPHHLGDARTSTLLVRADRPAPRNSGIGMGVDDTPPDRGADLGWGAHLAGPLQVAGLDTHHYGLLHPPAVAAVAAHLNTAVAGALALARI